MEQIMKYPYDLHLHTTNSDGEYTIKKIIAKAKKNGLNGIAITDHDVLGSIEDEKIIDENELPIVKGVEFATDISNMHFVGYMKSWQNEKLGNFLVGQCEARNIAAQKTIEKANKLFNKKMDFDTLISKYAKNTSIGRPHIARYMYELGIVNSVPEAFAHFLKKGKPLYVPKNRINFKDLIRQAKEEFKIIIGLAHPFLINADRFTIKKLILETIDCGIDGIEVNYSDHSDTERNELKKICENNGLLIFGGSDFHGEKSKPNIKIGDGGVLKEDFITLQEAIYNM